MTDSADSAGGDAPPAAAPPAPAVARRTLTDPGAYADSLAGLVDASPSSYHAAATLAARLEALGFSPLEETAPWDDVPDRGYVIRGGAVIAWILPERVGGRTAVRIVGSHTDSPALRLKRGAAISRDGYQLLNVEVYGGPLLNSFLDRDLGLAGRLTTLDGQVHLVRTGPLARVAQVAPHLDRSVNDSLHLDRQAQLTPLWSLQADGPGAVEDYLCELAGVDPADLAFHDVLTYPTEAPARLGRDGDMLASARLDNLSSVQASLVALQALGTGAVSPGEDDVVVMVANDHEEVGSATGSGAAGPFLSSVLSRLAGAIGYGQDAYQALLARSVCISADAGHAVHPTSGHLHDPVVRPRLNAGPLLKINAQQRYATDAVGAALWERACRAADVPHQDLVSNASVPCGSTIGPITATRLGITTVDVGVPLLSMHSQRELCGLRDGPWLAQALAAFWAGA